MNLSKALRQKTRALSHVSLEHSEVTLCCSDVEGCSSTHTDWRIQRRVVLESLGILQHGCLLYTLHLLHIDTCRGGAGGGGGGGEGRGEEERRREERSGEGMGGEKRGDGKRRGDVLHCTSNLYISKTDSRSEMQEELGAPHVG